MGQPWSQGEKAGEGMRLLLGTDLTGTPAYVVTDQNDINTGNQKLSPVNTLTRWLLPADLSNFDPRCDINDVTKAQAANCSLIGTFKSCTTGIVCMPGRDDS